MHLSIIKKIALATGTYRLARAAHKHIFDRDRLRKLPAEISLYHSLIPPGSLCFDVGANIGERSEALLEAGCEVVAFEPQEACVRELLARCKPYSRLRVLRAALGETPSIATLFLRSSSGQSGMVKDWEGTTIADIDVPVLTLDIAILRYGTPYYCKIDVEGYELQVLNGLSASIPLLSVEYHLTVADISKTIKCVKKLQGLGMRFANVTLAESPSLFFERWCPIEEFDSWFPSMLEGKDCLHYGDLWFSTVQPTSAADHHNVELRR